MQKDEWENKLLGPMTDELIRLREEVSMQYRALAEIKSMAKNMALIFQNPLKMLKKQYNGHTLDTLLP